MSFKSLSELAHQMAEIDVAMLSTHTEGGNIASRPMSNNSEVDDNGDSYYFTWEDSRMVADIEANPSVSLAFQGGKRFMVAIEGQAELVRDKGRFQQYWKPELDDWFEQGVETPGVVMIKVHATRAHYWSGEEGGEVAV
ncbi:pyridoxamine 5'-phosphate oxidase family protein [Xylophilus sp. GOD-11R]|uniref:pyridoxamine 5'-phosphate oxidase family protein n=1 Tax=Xylophilus sp. GOD-11R TaxID=3089814 RepID=UPI00298C1E0D|nr:pyridoxamine 5'-phosphate oxidase family protein [Xylophilus sp. GOD-11R]WPB57306.1 pyridoxamine 5'-phosphate oxidase family protein [Xylophilus sp. GOD-11R]